MGLDRQEHEHARAAAAADERQRGPVTRAQEGDDDERDKEDCRGAEVVHEREAAQADERQGHEQAQVFLAEQAVQRGGAREDVAQFGKL